jgi:hypothetical protein
MNSQTLIPNLTAMACFVLSCTTQAVNPPPGGGYPGSNTAEGQNALFSLTSGTYNTAVGFFHSGPITLAASIQPLVPEHF